MFNKISLLIILCLVFVNSNYGQQVSNTVGFPSPNAASLGEFGKVPVSLFTGTPDISIPIYEVKEGNFNIPITLRYHGSGIRVEEYPSWVGLGWTLQAGGAITRTIKGFEDDKVGYPGNNKYEGIGYFYSHDLLSQTNWIDYEGDGCDEKTYESFDKEPDEFNFYFNGISGSFYLDHNGDWVVKSDIPIKVECNKNNFKKIAILDFRIDSVFYEFKLTTPDGTAYVFGGDMPAIEFSRVQYGLTNLAPTATTWNLTRIIDPNGDEVTFNYIRGNLVPQLTYNESGIFTIDNPSNTDYVDPVMDPFWTLGLSWSDYFRGFSSIPTSPTFLYNLMLTEPSYLESIETKSQTVMFYSSTANDLQIPDDFIGPTSTFSLSRFCGSEGYWDIVSENVNNTGSPIDYNKQPHLYDTYAYEQKQIKFGIVDPELRKRKKLDNIVIFPKNASIPPNEYRSTPAVFSDAFKIIQFKYNEVSDKRLMLDGITASSSDYLVNENYAFDYFDSPKIDLPEYGTFLIDHWGYYNGRSSKLSDNLNTNYYLQRNPNEDVNYQLEGMLKTIKYPTGGYTEIDYEPHKYASYFYREIGQSAYTKYINIGEEEEDITCGGLRVKEIRSYTSEKAKPIKHTYNYVKNYSNSSVSSASSGYLMNIPRYVWSYNIFHEGNHDAVVFIQSNKSMLPLCSTGTHIGYSEVVDIEDGNGYTIYKYTMPSKTETEPTTQDDQPYQDLHPESYINISIGSPVNDRSLERGKLLSKEVYKIYNNSSIPVKKTTYKYNSDPNRFNSHVRSRNAQFLYERLLGVKKFLGTAILIYTYPFYVEEEKETNYVNGVAATTITNEYDYNTLGQVIAVSQTQSDGSKLTTEYRYPKDYPSSDSENSLIKQMVDKHIVNAEIEKISSTTKDGNKYTIGASFTKYGIFNGNIKPQTVYSLNLDKPMLSSDYNGWESAYNAIVESSFTLATSNAGNYHPQSISIELNPGDILRFDPSVMSKSDSENWMTLQIYRGKVELALFNCAGLSRDIPQLEYSEPGTYKFDLTYSYPTQNHFGTWAPRYTIYNNNGITINPSLKPAVTFNYNNKGNVIDIQKANDIHTSYIWGYNNIFPVIKAENMDDATLSSIVTSALPSGFPTLEPLLSSITSLPNANWTTFNKNLRDNIRSQAINCMISTYTYSPLKGMTSQTDTNGITTYYEYDSLGRLKLIRDNDQNILKTYEYNYKR